MSGIGNPLANPAVFGRPVAHAGDAFLMQLVIEERAVIADHKQQRNAIVHRRPDRGHAHAEIAVTADRDRQAAGAFERQRRAYRNARPAADAAAAFRADVVERVAEWPRGSVPGQRQDGSA